jgi:hypothetical protein
MDQADSDEWRAFRNRRKPADEEWAAARSVFASRAAVTGVVPSHHPFGFFVDLGSLALGLAGISHVKDPARRWLLRIIRLPTGRSQRSS